MFIFSLFEKKRHEKRETFTAIKTKFFKAEAKKTAIVTTTADYLRIERGDLCSLNGEVYSCKDVQFEKRQVILKLESRDGVKSYPITPSFIKPPAQYVPAPPPPLKVFNIVSIAGDNNKNKAPYFVYIEPLTFDLTLSLGGAVLNVPIITDKHQIINNINAQVIHLAPFISVVEANYTGLVVAGSEIMYVEAGVLIQRGLLNSIITEHKKGDQCFFVSEFSFIEHGNYFLEAIYNNAYPVGDGVLYSVNLKPKQQEFDTIRRYIEKQERPD